MFNRSGYAAALASFGVATPIAIAALSGSATASADGRASTAAKYCASSGGKVVALNYYGGGTGKRIGPGAIQLCEFKSHDKKDPSGTAFVDVNTLFSTRETLAAAAYDAGVKPTGKPKDLTPAAAYCVQVGGQPTLDGFWARHANGGQTGECMFEDRSFLDDWTLTYKAYGEPRGKDLTRVFRWHPATR